LEKEALAFINTPLGLYTRGVQ